jgi:hypothetical protein
MPIDASIPLMAAITPDVNVPRILQETAVAYDAMRAAPVLQQQRETNQQLNELGLQQQQQQMQSEQATRKAGVLLNYAQKLKSVPMAQRRTYLNTVDKSILDDIGIGADSFDKFQLDDQSLDAGIAQFSSIVNAGQQQRATSTRSESLAGGRITAQYGTDGSVKYFEFGKEIPQDQVGAKLEAAESAHAGSQQELYANRRRGALGEDLEFKSKIEGSVAQAKAESRGEEDRAQTVIDSGVDASYQLPTIRRTIDLLDEIETGGFNNIALKVKQAFGVEGADEGELSGNLGKAVLSQLRETFGAAFTENEGKRLERIEANFGKNAETNKRLLGNILELAERKVDDAISRAESRGDNETVRELKSNLTYKIGDDRKADQKVEEADSVDIKFLGFE